jgi:hypothetical protein
MPSFDMHWFFCEYWPSIHPDPFYVTIPNITSSILSPNPREWIYSMENYPHIVTIAFIYIKELECKCDNSGKL